MPSHEWRDRVERDLFVDNRARFISRRAAGFVLAILLTAVVLYATLR